MKASDKQSLVNMAIKAAENSYSPYSSFRVGAALLCADGSVFTGCNIENASYSATNCAERVAFQTAVASGKSDFVAIAVAGGKTTLGENPCPPCGVCRQVMCEFCKEDFIILLANKDGFKEYTLKQLLPLNFGAQSL